MLMVLEALVPCHLQKLKSNTVTMESASAARDEIAAIAALATSLQALLYSSETLTRFVSHQCWQVEIILVCYAFKVLFTSTRPPQTHDSPTAVPLRSGPQGRHDSQPRHVWRRQHKVNDDSNFEPCMRAFLSKLLGLCLQGQYPPAGRGPGKDAWGDGRANRQRGVPPAAGVPVEHLHGVLQTLRTPTQNPAERRWWASGHGSWASGHQIPHEVMRGCSLKTFCIKISIKLEFCLFCVF